MVLGGVQENFLYSFTLRRKIAYFIHPFFEKIYSFTIRRFQRCIDRGVLVKKFSFRYTEKKGVLC